MSVTDKNIITLPHIEGMFPHQLEVFEDSHRFKVLVWHRRSRKTSTALEKLVLEAHNPDLPPSIYWLVLPTYSMAKESVWKDPGMLFRVIPQELISKVNEAELSVYFKNGSILTLKGSDNPDSLRGAGPRGVVLDEFGTMKPEVWFEIVQPILIANNGWCWFIGTPKGKNHLYNLYLKGQEYSTEWKSWQLKASVSGVLSSDQLAAARQDMPEPLYNQEFEVEFLEGEGSVFRKVKEACVLRPQKALEGHVYVMGVDLGKSQDYTVCSVFDRTDNNMVYMDRFRTIEWPFQKKRIKEISLTYNSALISIDGTGLGSPIVDDLAREGLAVEPYKFTEASKKSLVEKLSIYLETGKVRLLNDPVLINELESYAYTLTPSGRVSYNAPSNCHDDCCISVALGTWVLNPLLVQDRAKKEASLMHEAKLRAYESQFNQLCNLDIIDPTEWGEWGQVEPGVY